MKTTVEINDALLRAARRNLGRRTITWWDAQFGCHGPGAPGGIVDAVSPTRGARA